MDINRIMSSLEAKHPGESEYLQAVREVLLSIEDIYNQHPEFEKAKIIERLVEPDRIFTFRVTWVDDKGEVQTNLGYRVQFNNAIGPYKGGIRFHASVNLSILKFLGFEQTFKNALTSLPMGGGKGGSDFSPRGRAMRKSCASARHISWSFGVIWDRTWMCRQATSAWADVRLATCSACTKTDPRIYGHIHRKGTRVRRFADTSRSNGIRRTVLRKAHA